MEGRRSDDRGDYFRPGLRLPSGQRCAVIQQGLFADDGVLDMALPDLLLGIAREDMFHPPGAEGPP
jgi:hypothetical protein